MYLAKTKISCGIKQLCDIGYSYDYGHSFKYRTMKEAYDGVMSKLDNCVMIIASLTTKQEGAITLLTNNGFKKVGKAKPNPNSGNKIILFVKHFNKPKKKTR